MIYGVPIGEPLSLERCLSLDIDARRPAQHLLVAGNGEESKMALLVAICAAALRDSSDPCVADLSSFYPSAGMHECLGRIAGVSENRISYSENDTESIATSTASVLIVVGLDAAGTELSPRDPYSSSDEVPSGAGDTLIERLRDGHRAGQLVVVFTERASAVREVLGHEAGDLFGNRIALEMPENDSMIMLDSRGAVELKSRAILRLSSGATQEFVPFRPPLPDQYSELGDIKAIA